MVSTSYPLQPDVKDKAGDVGTTSGNAGAFPTVKEAASDISENVKEMASGVAETAKNVADKVGDAVQTTRDTIGKFNLDLDDMIRRNPKQSVLIGVGVGCLLGLVLSGLVFNRG